MSYFSAVRLYSLFELCLFVVVDRRGHRRLE